MGCAAGSEARKGSIHELYCFQEKLGQGQTAQVHACVKRAVGLQCAVKVCLSGADCGKTDEVRRAELQQEGVIWKRVAGGLQIVNLLEIYAGAGHCQAYFVMERCGLPLCSALAQNEKLQEVDLLGVFREMLLGIQHCHSVQVVHRDAQPSNFFQSSDGAVKLCDFRSACLEEGVLVGRAGSPAFMSPEMAQGQQYNHKTDIWSLGASFYLMLYGNHPYPTRANGRRRSSLGAQTSAITLGEPPPYKPEQDLREPSALSCEFVQAILQRDPAERPSSTDCLQLTAMLPFTWNTMQDSDADQCLGAYHKGPVETIRYGQRWYQKKPMDPISAQKMDLVIQKLQAPFQHLTPHVAGNTPDSDEQENQKAPLMCHQEEPEKQRTPASPTVSDSTRATDQSSSLGDDHSVRSDDHPNVDARSTPSPKAGVNAETASTLSNAGKTALICLGEVPSGEDKPKRRVSYGAVWREDGIVSM